MGELIADLLALPSWAPRMIRRAAGVVLGLAVVFAPATFLDGVRMYADRTTEVLVRRMQPMLENLGAPAVDAGQPSSPRRHTGPAK